MAQTETSLSFRSGLEPDTPVFRLQLGERKETIRRMTPLGHRTMEAHVPKLAAFLVRLFDDVDRVVNESNSLIDAQHTIASVTKGPMFNAWNRTYVESL